MAVDAISFGEVKKGELRGPKLTVEIAEDRGNSPWTKKVPRPTKAVVGEGATEDELDQAEGQDEDEANDKGKAKVTAEVTLHARRRRAETQANVKLKER